MPTADIFFQKNSDMILVLAFAVLIAKITGIILLKLRKDYAQQSRLDLLLCTQPWVPAAFILANFLISFSLVHYEAFNSDAQIYLWITYAQEILAAVFTLWLLLSEVKSIYSWLTHISSDKPLLQALLPYLKKNLYFLGLILALPFVIPSFLQTGTVNYYVTKITWVLIIWTIAWMVIEVIVGLENITLQRLSNNLTDNFSARRAYTQARLFKRMAMVFVFIIATALSAMMFDNIREIGTSILASAGLATVILGFAAQKTLGNLFAGIQIAVTQPIRIHDTVTIENELGVVEEISLTYAVIRIWDLRRLIIPINYFLEKPFQNLTRSSTNLLCPITFSADYNLPVARVREEFMKILKESKSWDGQIANLQVTDVKDNVLQVRALASAEDSNSSWNLRCEVLEKLIHFIVKNHPESLPKTRNTLYPN